jgi:hypothetical protein
MFPAFNRIVTDLREAPRRPAVIFAVKSWETSEAISRETGARKKV